MDTQKFTACPCWTQISLVQKGIKNAPVRKIELIYVEGMKKSRGRLKITIVEVIKKDMPNRKVTESMTSNKIEWKKRMHMVDLTNLMRIHS